MSFDRVFPLDKVHAVSQLFLSPLSYGLYQGAVTLNDGVRFVKGLPGAYGENIVLQEEISTLNESIVEIERLHQENAALREQLGVQGTRTERKLFGSVVGFIDEGPSILMIIDKGTNDGVNEGMIALIGQSLVGRVVRTTSELAYVLPPYAVDSRIPGKVVNGASAAEGLVKGQFNSRIILDEVLQETTLKPGDIVVTSGTGGVYPSDLTLGRVTSIEVSDNQLFKSAMLEPLWDIKKLKSVFIVLGG